MLEEQQEEKKEGLRQRRKKRMEMKIVEWEEKGRRGRKRKDS